MMNYDDRDGSKPLDFNKIHENEQKVAAGVPISGGKSRFDALERVGQSYQPPTPKQPKQIEPKE